MAEKTRRRRFPWSRRKDGPSGDGERPPEPVDPEREAFLRARASRLLEPGATVTPLVVHGDEVVGWNDDYEAFRIVGLEDMCPRITLEEVFAEAGMDFDQISAPEGEEEGAAEREFFEDYLRSLPEHIRDKYGL